MPVKKPAKLRLGSSANGCHQRGADGPKDAWSRGFLFHPTTSCWQRKRLSGADEYTRECLPLKGDRGITSKAVVETLADRLAMRSVPQDARSDLGGRWQ